jgi:hypothetical protein
LIPKEFESPHDSRVVLHLISKVSIPRINLSLSVKDYSGINLCDNRLSDINFVVVGLECAHHCQFICDSENDLGSASTVPGTFKMLAPRRIRPHETHRVIGGYKSGLSSRRFEQYPVPLEKKWQHGLEGSCGPGHLADIDVAVPVDRETVRRQEPSDLGPGRGFADTEHALGRLDL